MRSPPAAICLGNCARLYGCGFVNLCLPFSRRSDHSVPFRPLAGTTRRRCFFSCRLLRGFFTEAPLHFAEHAFALHFLLQDARSLINVVVTDQDLHKLCSGAIESALVMTSGTPRTRRPM